MKKYLFLLLFATLFFVNIDEAQATFEDGKYTKITSRTPLIFHVNASAGDVLEFDIRADRWVGWSIQRPDKVIIKSYSMNGEAGNRTFSYTFAEDYSGFLLTANTDGSTDAFVYEVRLNDKMVFDGKSFVVELEELGETFVSVTPFYNKATLKFDVESLVDREIEKIFLYNGDGVVLTSFNNATYTINNLKPGTEYVYFVSVDFGNGQVTKKQQVVFMTKEIPKLDESVEVSDVTSKSAKLNFNFLGVAPEQIKIYDSNGKLYTEFPNYVSVTSKDITGLEQNKEYTFYVTGVFSGVETERYAVTFTTKEVSPEVANLTAKAKYNRVDLSWNLPERNDFEYVTIYRKENQKALFSLFSVGEEYDPLFETNGTYFNDLTVKPETSYTYLLTSYLSSGEETKGVTIDVETPPVEISGGDTNVDEESGDYVITWTEPTEGKILVTVGGKEYAVVNASDLKIIIPKENMKFDKLGYPDVTLTPLDENEVPIGKPSKPGDMGSVVGDVEIDLNENNLLQMGIGLLGVIGGFVLLGLAFLVVKKLINSVVLAFKGG